MIWPTAAVAGGVESNGVTRRRAVVSLSLEPLPQCEVLTMFLKLKSSVHPQERTVAVSV